MNSYRNDRKVDKEQYYTNTNIAKQCFDIARKYVGNDLLLEPCGGTGEFVKNFETVKNKFSAFDIDPKYDHCELQDYFDVDFINGPFSVITNPPYGRNNSLSVRFFNKSAELGANYICFLIPVSWRKWNIQNRLHVKYHLVEDVEVTSKDMFYGDEITDKKGEMRCIFQVWERKEIDRKPVKIKDNKFLIRSTPEKGDIKLTQQSYESKILEVFTEFERIKIPGNFYYKIDGDYVIEALKEIRKEKLFKRFTDNSMYFAKSISLNEINYLLNEKLNYHEKTNISPL